MSETNWYVVHTYSGYENKVKANIEKTVENRNLHELIPEIRIPMEETMEQTGDEKKAVSRKMLPGYVIIKMQMTDESWYVVRNTRGVTGFVGPGSKPVPLTDAEVEDLGFEHKFIEAICSVGDNVRVKNGPLEDFVGIIGDVMADKQKYMVTVSMFGRETPVELDFDQVELLEF